MAHDRWVYWTSEPPSHDALDRALRTYVGGAGEVEWNAAQSRWYATIEGGESPMQTGEAWDRPADPARPRWFEVYYHPGPDAPHVSVITRMCDQFTLAVAEGFAARVALQWDGRREGEGTDDPRASLVLAGGALRLRADACSHPVREAALGALPGRGRSGANGTIDGQFHATSGPVRPRDALRLLRRLARVMRDADARARR